MFLEVKQKKAAKIPGRRFILKDFTVNDGEELMI
jgi:hypothetical protein